MTKSSKAWAWLSSRQGLCTTAGALALAATTNANIMHWGGWYTTNAPVIAAMSLGIFAGARALGSNAKGLGLLGALLVGTIIAGEAFNFIATAEVTITERDAKATPIRDDKLRYDNAVARVAALEAGPVETARVKLAREALARLNDTTRETARVERARADLKAARDAYEGKVTKTGDCRGACQVKLAAVEAAKRELAASLNAQRTDSATALTSAQAELQAALVAAASDHKVDLETARANLKQTPMPADDAPLANRIGWAAWALDLLAAFLRSIGGPGLAAVLITLGAKRDPDDQAGLDSRTVADPALPGADNDPGPGNGPGPGIAAPQAPKSGKRGRRPSADVLEFSKAFRARNGRTPTGPEIRAHFPDMGRSTAYDYASRVRATG